jgi:hypothetical protein
MEICRDLEIEAKDTPNSVDDGDIEVNIGIKILKVI